MVCDRCMLRVLDSFGTEPEFNHAHYAQSKGHKTPWGKWNLNPQQFNTMFRKYRLMVLGCRSRISFSSPILTLTINGGNSELTQDQPLGTTAPYSHLITGNVHKAPNGRKWSKTVRGNLYSSKKKIMFLHLIFI